jgi:hypothetical protein
MGAWDASSFGNDTAIDWAYSLEQCSDFSCIEKALQRVLDAGNDYLEAPEAEEGVAAAEVIAWLQGWPGKVNTHPEKVATWVQAHPLRPSKTLVNLALDALDRVQGAQSELAELWEGNTKWKAAMRNLRTRLSERFRAPKVLGKTSSQPVSAKKTKRSATFGDVFVLPTPKGFALLQYVNRVPRFAELIRVLPGIYETMPTEVGSIVARKELYFLEFSISAAAKDGDVKHIGNFPIPAWAVDWPTMRAPQTRLDGKQPEWWAILHAGELIASDAPDERRITRLTREQRKLSIARWWSIPRFVERLVEGWRPEHDY